MSEPSQQKNRLYVGNLDYRLPIQAVELLFAGYGIVKDVFMPLADTEGSRINKGIAFVEMLTEDAAENAVKALDGEKEPVFKRKLVVQYARERKAV